MDSIKSRRKLLKSALIFLDKGKTFEKIKTELKKTIDKDQLVYSFNIDIDLGNLFDHDVLLGNSVLQWPLESSSLFQEIIYHFCQSHNLLPPDSSSAQVFAHLKIVNFPSCGLQIHRIQDLVRYMNYPGFVKLLGVVSGISGLSKFTQCTKYVCPLQECQGHNGNQYIRMHVSGALETHIIRNDFRCIYCGEILEEDLSFRNLADKMVIEILPIKILHSGKEEILKNERNQAIAVILRDEQVKSVELGHTYDVIGTCRVDFHGEDINISLELKPHMLISLTSSPSIIQKLLDVCSSSPWGWSFYLAHVFGAKIVPGGVMIKLRLLLLISIVINPEVNNIHILSFGKETGLFFSLVTLAQRLAQRFFPVTETSPIIGKVMKDKYTWAPFFFQGGSLVLSYGGICYLGNISEWKKSKKDLIQTALTTNKIFLDLTFKPAGRLAQQLTFPLNCQVWALAESSGKQNFSTNSRDVFNRQQSHGDLSKSFMDAFSYICYLDCEDPGTEDETVVDVANHILSSYMKTDESEPLEIELQDIEYLIALARQTEVKLSPEAEELLQSYYRASRMTRSSGFSGSHVPPSAIHTL
ncbi:hypothetical protein Btru_071033 [Bulinus truncatus]|nr:hypothetical protein Btru_071033 [Bulinus truncatus]